MSDTFFTKDFKEKILAGLVQDKRFLREAVSVLKPDHFEEIIHQAAVEQIFNCYTKNGGLPSKTWLLNELINDMARRERIKTDGDRQKLIIKPVEQFIEKIFSPLNGGISDVQDKFIEYCKTQDMKSAAAEVYNGLDTGQMDFNDAFELVRKVHKKTNKLNDAGFDFFNSLDIIRGDFTTNNLGRMTTGFPTLDRLMGGGPAKGTLTTVVAPLKGGKSMFLTNVAYANLRAGRTVVHFTLEINQKVMSRRMLARISGFDMQNEDTPPSKWLENNLDAALKKSDQFYKLHKGRYIVKEFMQGATVDELRSYLYGLESSLGIKPDVICIDYGDLVRSANRKISDDERLQQGAAYIEMRWLMAEFDAAGFTASQSNRESLEKEWVKIKHIAEDISKARHSDHVLTLSQTEEEYQNRRARIHFAASRDAKTGARIELMTRWANCTMTEIHPHGMPDKERQEITVAKEEKPLTEPEAVVPVKGKDEEWG